MGKIVSYIGNFVRVDKVTQEKSNLFFARVLVEVKIDQEFPEMVQFLNEKGAVIDQKVFYAWKPIKCSSCTGYGHSHEQCFKPVKQKKRWVVKADHGKPDTIPARLAEKEARTQISRVEHQEKVGIPQTNNSFAVLTEASTEELFYEMDQQGGLAKGNEMQGLEAPESNG